MFKRVFPTGVLAMGLLTGFQSNAQSFCETLQAAAAQAPSKFRSWRGARDNFGDYRSSFILPGATDCYIEGQDLDLVCKWRNSSEEARVASWRLARGIHQCYPRAEFSDRSSMRRPAYSIRTDGLLFRVHANDRQTIFLGIGMDN